MSVQHSPKTTRSGTEYGAAFQAKNNLNNSLIDLGDNNEDQHRQSAEEHIATLKGLAPTDALNKDGGGKASSSAKDATEDAILLVRPATAPASFKDLSPPLPGREASKDNTLQSTHTGKPPPPHVDPQGHAYFAAHTSARVGELQGRFPHFSTLGVGPLGQPGTRETQGLSPHQATLSVGPLGQPGTRETQGLFPQQATLGVDPLGQTLPPRYGSALLGQTVQGSSSTNASTGTPQQGSAPGPLGSGARQNSVAGSRLTGPFATPPQPLLGTLTGMPNVQPMMPPPFWQQAPQLPNIGYALGVDPAHAALAYAPYFQQAPPMPHPWQLHPSATEGIPTHNYARVSKPPPFWPSKPQMWFMALEAYLEAMGITSDAGKISSLLSHLDEKSMTIEVETAYAHAAIGKKYTSVKAALIKKFTDTPEQQLRKLLSEMKLGDKRPSELWLEMVKAAGRRMGMDSASMSTNVNSW